MVRRAYVTALNPQRVKFAAVKYMVYTEIESVGVISNRRPESDLGKSVREIVAANGAYGVTVGDVVEIAAHYDILPTDAVYVVAEIARLLSTHTERDRQLPEKLMTHFVKIGHGIEARQRLEQFLVIGRQAD